MLFMIVSNAVTKLYCQQRNNEFLEVRGSLMKQATSAFQQLLQEIPGEAGVDYPVLASVPDTGFSCDNRVSGGYYADTETACQVFRNIFSSIFKILLYKLVISLKINFFVFIVKNMKQ